MLNKVAFVGRLTKNPEVKTVGNNQTPVAKFTIAVDRTFKREGQPKADFIPIVVFGKSADNCGKYLTKGRLITVSGRLQTRSWEDQDGKKHYVTEVIADEVNFLPTGKKQEGEDSDSNSYAEEYEGFTFDPDADDDLPF